MALQYQYIKIYGRFFCLQQNPAMFAWVLFLKKDTFYDTFYTKFKRKQTKFQPWTVSWIKYNVCSFINKLKIVIYFIACQLKLKKNDNKINLPVYGHLGVSVHKGYKIFDLRRGVVTKVFNKDNNKSIILSEIEQLEKVSKIPFASSIRGWSIEERLYEEDYINGSLDSRISRDSATLLKKFYHDIAPCLDSLILFQKPMIHNAIEYINEMIKISKVSRLSRQRLTAGEFNKIQSFIDSVSEDFRGVGNCSVYLVFTHGDFCPANMLNTRKGIRIIDWESAGNRSALFDFYSYFFFHPVSRKVPVNTLISEINEALPCFISKLAEKAPDISKNLLALASVYRWLYYVERISMLLERQMTDTNLNILNYISRYIDVFNSYEEVLRASTGKGEPVK